MCRLFETVLWTTWFPLNIKEIKKSRLHLENVKRKVEVGANKINKVMLLKLMLLQKNN